MARLACSHGLRFDLWWSSCGQVFDTHEACNRACYADTRGELLSPLTDYKTFNLCITERPTLKPVGAHWVSVSMDDCFEKGSHSAVRSCDAVEYQRDPRKLYALNVPSGCDEMMNGKASALLESGPTVGYFIDDSTSGGLRSREPKAQIPIQFFFEVGHDGTSLAPLCAGSFEHGTACDGLMITYKKFKAFGDASGEPATKRDFGYQFARSLTTPSKLPLHLPIAASSAFVGGTQYGHVPDVLPSYVTQPFLKATLPWDLSSWVDVDGFVKSRGYAGLNDHAQAAARGLVSLADGGLAENRGVGWAVANGADTVVLFANNAVIDDLNKLMPGPFPSPFEPSIPAFDLVTGTNPYANYAIFERPPDLAATMASVGRSLTLTPGRYVKSVEVGGPMRLTTNANPWFGIEAGRAVNLYYIGADSTLGIGGTENFRAFDEALQQIVSTLTDPANRADASKLLDVLKGR